MLGFKLIHGSKRGPWRPVQNGQTFADNICRYIKKIVLNRWYSKADMTKYTNMRMRHRTSVS